MCIQTHPRLSKTKRPTSPSTTSKHFKFGHETNTTQDRETTSVDQINHEVASTSFDPTTIDRTNNKNTSVSYTVAPDEQTHHKKEIKKSVTFFERVIVRPVLHVDNYSDQEWENCWYAPADKQQRKSEIREALRLIREGNFEGCKRGLEKMSDRGRTKERRRISVREVLDEQEAQRAEAKARNCEHIVYDAARFRTAYRPHSRAARHVAHALGRIDEMAAACQMLPVPHPACSRRCSPKSAIACIHTNDFGTFLQIDFIRS